MWYDNDFPRLLADRDQESPQELTNTITETIEVLQNGAKFQQNHVSQDFSRINK